MICAAKINVRNSRKGSCAASHNWGLLQAQAHSGFPSPLEKKQLILLSHSEANQDFSRKISKISTFIKHAVREQPSVCLFSPQIPPQNV